MSQRANNQRNEIQRAAAGRVENRRQRAPRTANQNPKSLATKSFPRPKDMTALQLSRFLQEVPPLELSHHYTKALRKERERAQQYATTSSAREVEPILDNDNRMSSSSTATLRNMSQRTEEMVRHGYEEATFAIPEGPRVGSNVLLASQRPMDYDDDMFDDDDEDQTEPPTGPPEPPTGPVEPPSGPVDPLRHIPVLNISPDNNEFCIVKGKLKNLEDPKSSCVVRQLLRLGFPNFTEADIVLPIKCHPMRLTGHWEVVSFTVTDSEKAKEIQTFLLSTNYHRVTLQRNIDISGIDTTEHAYLSTEMTKEQSQLCGLIYNCFWIYKAAHQELRVFFGGDRLIVEDDDSTYNVHLTDLIRNEKDIVRQGIKVSRRKTMLVSNVIKAMDPDFQLTSN